MRYSVDEQKSPVLRAKEGSLKKPPWNPIEHQARKLHRGNISPLVVSQMSPILTKCLISIHYTRYVTVMLAIK